MNMSLERYIKSFFEESKLEDITLEEKINVLREDVFEQNPKLDRYYQTMALEYYEKLRDFCEKTWNELFKATFDISKYTEEVARHFKLTDRGYEVTINGIPTVFRERTPQANKMSTLGEYDWKNNVFYFNLLTPGEKVFNIGVLNICLSDIIEELVIHEFTHKLDVDALKGSGKKIPKVKDYNNSDIEFNAWSNALIRRLERFYIYNKDKFNLTDRLYRKSWLKEFIVKGIEDIRNGKDNRFLHDYRLWLNNLNDSNVNRLYNKIYNYFDKAIYEECFDPLNSVLFNRGMVLKHVDKYTKKFLSEGL